MSDGSGEPSELPLSEYLEWLELASVDELMAEHTRSLWAVSPYFGTLRTNLNAMAFGAPLRLSMDEPMRVDLDPSGEPVTVELADDVVDACGGLDAVDDVVTISPHATDGGSLQVQVSWNIYDRQAKIASLAIVTSDGTKWRLAPPSGVIGEDAVVIPATYVETRGSNDGLRRFVTLTVSPRSVDEEFADIAQEHLRDVEEWAQLLLHVTADDIRAQDLTSQHRGDPVSIDSTVELTPDLSAVAAKHGLRRVSHIEIRYGATTRVVVSLERRDAVTAAPALELWARTENGERHTVPFVADEGDAVGLVAEVVLPPVKVTSLELRARPPAQSSES